LRFYLITLLALMILIPANANPFAPLPGDARAMSFEDFKSVFYENQAKGMFPRYEELGQKDVFIHHFHKLSEELDKSLTPDNRSKLLLNTMRVVNSFHDEEHELRFAILEKLRAEHLYDLIWIWQSALYTSSFNGALDRLIIRVLKSPRDFVNHLKGDSYQGFISLVQTASSFNRLEDFLSVFELKDKQQFFDVLVQNLMLSGRMDYLITLGEWLLLKHEIPHQKPYLRILVRDMLDWQAPENRGNFQYEIPPSWTLSATVQLEEKELFGVLVQILTRFEKLNSEHLALQDTPLHKFLNAYSHVLPSFENLEAFSHRAMLTQSFMDREGSEPLLLRHLYYGDSDGWATYLNFVRLYQRDPDWTSQDQGDLMIFSREGENGMRLKLVLNKPSRWSKVLKNQRMNPYAFVHRGHSYHLHRGYDTLTENTKLAFLGSCGGFDSMFKILKRSPEAKILYSKGKGTVWINESMLYAIHNQLATHGQIDWSTIREESWEKLDALISERFLDRYKTKNIFEQFYILPHENLGAICYQTWLQREDYKNKLAWTPIQK